MAENRRGRGCPAKQLRDGTTGGESVRYATPTNREPVVPLNASRLLRRGAGERLIPVPDETVRDLGIDAWLHTGRNAHAALRGTWGALTTDPDTWVARSAKLAVQRSWRGVQPGAMVAVDIETPGLDPLTINCVTVAWLETDGTLHSALLDASRRAEDGELLTWVLAAAGWWVYWNAPYDIAGLVPNGFTPPDQVRAKMLDGLVSARMIDTASKHSRSLEAAAKRYLGLSAVEGGMGSVFKAAGFATKEAGYLHMDIDRPTYRRGAMIDTAVTLRLWPVLTEAVADWLTHHRYPGYGATTREAAHRIHADSQRVHRIMAARGGAGIAVDTDYLDEYTDRMMGPLASAAATLTDAGIDPGNGQHLMRELDRRGLVPPGWKRTGTGKLSSAKEDLELLPGIELVAAHRFWKNTDRLLHQYMAKAAAQASRTGRCYPMFGTHGATATGRASYTGLELHQFSGAARGILIPDDRDREHGFASVDLSSIEPVTLANLAVDTAFLAPYERGEDLYYPMVDALGLPQALGFAAAPTEKDPTGRVRSRKVSKVVLLGIMYTMGAAKLAANLGLYLPDGSPDVERAKGLRQQVIDYLGAMSGYMRLTEHRARQYGHTVTVAGRVLSMEVYNGEVVSRKAVNAQVQGSAYDQLAYAKLLLDDLGLSQHIYLSMHDELVVSGNPEIAAEVQRALMTPHPGFEHWTKNRHTPVIRSDMQFNERWWSPD